MSRFIYTDHELININSIHRVTNMDNGIVEITLTNGTHFEAPEAIWNEILGYDHVVALCPCEHLSLNVTIRGRTQMLPVQYMAVTASGDIRPMNKDLVFLDSIQGAKLNGYECCEGDDDAFF